MKRTLRRNPFTLFAISIIILLLVVNYSLKQRCTVSVEKQLVAQNRKNRQAQLAKGNSKMGYLRDDTDSTHSFPPCGQICNFSMHKKKEDLFLRKDFNCKNIFLRLKNPPGKVFIPPLREPPPELLLDFTQNGSLMWSSDYRDGTRKGRKVHRKSDEIRTLLADDKVKSIAKYDIQGVGYKQLLSKYQDQLKGKSGMVIGSISPWVEVILLNLGVIHVTTVDYNPVLFDHPQLSFEFMSDLADKITKNQKLLMDFAASFSSLEHSGLGRYGDPINPYGDLEAAAQIWCMLKPGALFYLGIPVNFGTPEGWLVFNAHRIYGEARIEQITANYEILERTPVGRLHGVFVLRKGL
ncbi:uncharacterized protein LOC106159024 [Lingula anatina]|uniref:Uncharacterized protein LOC106159024 n=1 Tax=Lingula anatina TaxID=7574 RepID=A0A1S3HX85_LINAN|nr:uncharacterized protein LOC106159024 [Lingula anatina]XP_013390641.1 uncharacterized protein LOC106159024 [Lingula anatina]|eukprot:XP_013390640.1 uncharacterized protein LOC106159024 [Lingula anatina]